jgi:signal peptidase
MRILAGATTVLRRIVDLGLVVLIVVVLLGVVLGKGAPLVGRQSIVIGGGSMEPTIGLGSTIIIQPVDAAALAVGDIVSLQVGPERTTYTHRIVAVVDRPDGRWIRTRGDANPEPDPTLVPVSAVIGRVELVIPLAGYLLALLSLPVGVMFVLGLAATLLAVAWLLESLELEAEPAERRPAADPAHAAPDRPAPDRRAPDRPAPAMAGDMTSGGQPAELERLRGEPIAVRPTAIALAAAGPGGAVGAAAAVISPWRQAPRSPGRAGVARPTVRQQIERSRETRNRRARWTLGRETDQRAADGR